MHHSGTFRRCARPGSRRAQPPQQPSSPGPSPPSPPSPQPCARRWQQHACCNGEESVRVALCGRMETVCRRRRRTGRVSGCTPASRLCRLPLLALDLAGALELDDALVALADIVGQRTDLRQRTHSAGQGSAKISGKQRNDGTCLTVSGRTFSLCSRARLLRIFLFSSSINLRTCAGRPVGDASDCANNPASALPKPSRLMPGASTP